MTLARQFAAYSEWRGHLAAGIEGFRQWLAENELNDAQTELRISQLQDRLREDRLLVAFVAEFSRGKSELINAIFFAGFGDRVLPSAAGRTTMCPSELMFDPTRAPAIELLPIETRATNAGVAEYRRFPEEWRSFPLDTGSADAMRDALAHVSEVVRVPPAMAANFGFPIANAAPGGNADDSFRPGDDGLIEIPRWRHAVINFPHPLLRQGLVILDTPGLNAIGTEPELTLSLLPNAHATLFVLAADAGVTRSDLAIWREHLSAAGSHSSGRLVVLNKIDGLWDELKNESEIDAQIAGQVDSCAQTLGLPPARIFPVSAQKALVGKINGDDALLARSRLPALELALGDELIHAKRDIVRDNADGEFGDLHARMRRLLESRLAGLREQIAELDELRGKNKGVVEYMMGKVRAEKEEFEAGLQRYYAVRSVFSQLTNKLFAHLGLDALRSLTQSTRETMVEATFSKTLSEAMRNFFGVARDNLARSKDEIDEIVSMMQAIYRKFTVEHGLKLGAPTGFSLLAYEKEIERLEEWCDTHLNTMRQLITHEKSTLTQKFFEEVAVQVRRAFEHANRDAEAWLKAIMAPMETQVREHQIQLKRRLESIKRIYQATDTLEDRIGELTHVEDGLVAQLAALERIAAEIRAVLGQPAEALAELSAA